MDNYFKDLILKGLAKKALKALFLKYPFLSWGPIGWFVQFLTNQILEFISEYLIKVINIQKVIFKNEALEDEYARSSVKLQIIADSYAEDSLEYQEARDEAIESFHNFVMFDIAA